MTIEESLQSITHLFLDTAPVIYYVEQNPQYFATVRIVFNSVLDGSLIAVVSPVTLSECLAETRRSPTSVLVESAWDECGAKSIRKDLAGAPDLHFYK